MTAPKSTQITQALKARLDPISPANGYYTDLKAVYRGLEGLSLPADTPLPVLAIRTLSDAQTDRQGVKGRQSREVHIEGLIEVTDDHPEDALDALLWDIRTALNLAEERTLGGLAVSIEPQTATYDYPESGSAIVKLTLPLTITYIDTYTR